MDRESSVCSTTVCFITTISANKATFLSAEDFNVTLPFLLQHVAWLYDRRLSQVRAQFRKVGHQNPLSGQTTSAGGGTPGGSVPMNRSGSDGMGNQRREDGRDDMPLKPPVLGSRIQSRLFALQRDISATQADSSCPPTPNISQGWFYTGVLQRTGQTDINYVLVSPKFPPALYYENPWGRGGYATETFKAKLG